MHELSVAESLVELVEVELAANPAAIGRVAAVRIRVGDLSGVVAAALVSAFGAATEGTCIAGTRLEIDRVAVAIWCHGCGKEFELPPETVRLRCPGCDGTDTVLLRGRELELVSLEMI